MSNNNRQGEGKDPEKEIPSARSDDSDSSSEHYSDDGFLFTRHLLTSDKKPLLQSKRFNSAKDLERQRLQRRTEMQSNEALPSSSDGKSANAATPSERRVRSTSGALASSSAQSVLESPPFSHGQPSSESLDPNKEAPPTFPPQVFNLPLRPSENPKASAKGSVYPEK